MPRTGWTPSLAPKGDDPTVYLVVDDFGRNGRIFREADIEATDLDTVVADLLDGQYKNPLRVVALNTAEGWSQDVSSEIAQELAAVASFKCATCRRAFKILWSGPRPSAHVAAGVSRCHEAGRTYELGRGLALGRCYRRSSSRSARRSLLFDPIFHFPLIGCAECEIGKFPAGKSSALACRWRSRPQHQQTDMPLTPGALTRSHH